jgi:hypothetical protein
LRHWGYTNLLATASPQHHNLLKSYGAVQCFDYRHPKAIDQILDSTTGSIPFVLDCIGSKSGSVIPISKIAKKGAAVAVLLPVVVKDASETEAPVYEMDVAASADWADEVNVRGVRTHYYLDVRAVLLFLWVI